MFYLLLLLLAAQDQPTFHSDVALVHMDAEVRQNGQTVAGLGRESFQVTDHGKPQTILYFGHQEEPLDVVLLFDARGEMRAEVERVAAMAQTATGDLRQGDRLAVMAFGDEAARPCADLVSDFTGDFGAFGPSMVGEVLQRIGLRTIHCVMARAFSGVAQHFLGRPNGVRRRAIVVVTDDKGTGVRPQIVRNAVHDLWKADAVVLGVIVPSEAPDVWIGPPYRGAHYFASQTGGDVLNTGDAAQGLQVAIHRLRSRYSLYYALPQGKPGEERQIRVKLASVAAKRYPRAIVRARTGYVAPSANP